MRVSPPLRTLTALGLMVAGTAAWREGVDPPFPEGAGAVLFVALVAVTVLLLADLAGVARRGALPEPLRRPGLAYVGCGVYGLSALILAAPSPSGVLWVAGAAVFVWDTWLRRREPAAASPSAAPWRLGELFSAVAAPETSAGAGGRAAVRVALGLYALSWLAGPSRPPGELIDLLLVAWLALLVPVALEQIRPAWVVGWPAWLRRPTLGAVASAVFLVDTALVLCLDAGSLLFAGATALFVWDAARHGELGPFEPRLLWRGWRVCLLAGALLAWCSFSVEWTGGAQTFGYTRSWTSGRYEYTERVPGVSFKGTAAQAQGVSVLPALLMLLGLGAAVWRPVRPAAPWRVFVPLATAAVLVVIGVNALAADQQRVASFPRGGVAEAAGGPWLFLLAMAPYALGAAVLARGPAAVAEAPGATAGPATAPSSPRPPAA